MPGNHLPVSPDLPVLGMQDGTMGHAVVRRQAKASHRFACVPPGMKTSSMLLSASGPHFLLPEDLGSVGDQIPGPIFPLYPQ